MRGALLVVAGDPPVNSTVAPWLGGYNATRWAGRLVNPGLIRPGAWLPAWRLSGAAALRGGRGAGPQERQPQAGAR